MVEIKISQAVEPKYEELGEVIEIEPGSGCFINPMSLVAEDEEVLKALRDKNFKAFWDLLSPQLKKALLNIEKVKKCVNEIIGSGV